MSATPIRSVCSRESIPNRKYSDDPKAALPYPCARAALTFECSANLLDSIPRRCTVIQLASGRGPESLKAIKDQVQAELELVGVIVPILQNVLDGHLS